MITKIRLKNFFSFSDQTIELGSANFLIGINGSGKSNLIKAFKLLKATLVEGELEKLIINRWGGFDAICFSGIEPDADQQFSLQFEFDPSVLGEYGYKFQDAVEYQISFRKVASSQNYTIKENFHTLHGRKKGYEYMNACGGKGVAREGNGADQRTVKYNIENLTDSLLSQLSDQDRYYQIFTLRKAISDIAIYSYFDTTETSLIRKPAMPSGASKLLGDGSNLPQLLNWINLNNKRDFVKIKQSLSTINPKISGIDFHLLGTNIEILLEEEKLNRSVHVTHVSDGTLRFLCMMAIIHNSKRGRFVCIDEPEVGLHPDMIAELMEGINDISCETQFLISSHSEIILNQTTVDNVLVCEKDQNNATEVKTYRTEEFKTWASKYTVGTLWRNGDLGGNRY